MGLKMRSNAWIVGTLALVLAACSVGRPSSRPSGPYAGGPMYGPGQPAGVAPHPGAGWMPPPGAVGRPLPPRPPGVQPLPAYGRPVDTFAMKSLQGSSCAPEEVAPGVWVRFDCTADQAITRAKALVQPKSFINGPLPLAIDHRSMGIAGPIKDQGAVGACTAFSLSTAMDNAIRKQGKQDVVAPLHVWSKYAVPVMGVAGDETLEKRITSESVWPYDPAKACKLLKTPFDSCGAAYKVASGTGFADSNLQAERKHADSSGIYRVASIEQLKTKPVDTNELMAVLAGGDAVWAAFWTNSKAWKSSSLENGVLPHYDSVGQTGHAVALAGYRTVGGERQYLMHNSWGPTWGENGFGWIREKTLIQHIRSAYRVRVSDAEPGQPDPPPSSGGCPAGQAKDAVFQTCAPACPNGSPPSAGVCLPTVPGFPLPGPQPQQQQCPQGQGFDPMMAQCAPLCANGVPPIGGMCLPGFGP